MEALKSIEKYGSLGAVVGALGVERSVAAILRSADQCAFDEVRPRSSTWIPVERWPGPARRVSSTILPRGPEAEITGSAS